MMNNTMSAGPAFFWLHIHWVFAFVALFAFVAAIIWYSKHASKKQSQTILIWALVIGIVGMVATSFAAASSWVYIMGHHGMMNKYNNHHKGMMMDYDTMEDMHEMMGEMKMHMMEDQKRFENEEELEKHFDEMEEMMENMMNHQ